MTSVKDDFPSRTAYGVAMSRAAHQILDSPRVLDDPVALAIMGPKAAGAIRAAPRRFDHRFARQLRAFLVARSRLAEDALGEAVARGVRQYVVLGAGLDTFAFRNPHAAAGLRVFEVDHPATQEWKRSLISQAHLKPPGPLVYVPVDFEREQLDARLAANGFRADEPAFFSWLGVTMYLSREAIAGTLGFVARCSVSRSGIVFDYLVAPPRWALLRRWGLALLMRHLAAAGEPWRTFLEPASLHRELTQLGFATVRDFGAEEINARYFEGAGAHLRAGGSARVVLARI
ncbi:MAG TPA: class I SAM-dependent methyltransferase [Steroidobacteraceae bacterium]|nr:class I SAM-dependent methyltransferase [Steroidobacteraceae bacterium]